MNNCLWNDDKLLEMSWKDQVLKIAAEGAEERIIRALIKTRPESEWAQLQGANTPSVIFQAINTLLWEKENVQYRHPIKEQPHYRPVDEVLADFYGKGKKQAARKELQVRLPYLTAHEQKQIIYAFLDTEVKTDRVFALKYLDAHFDPLYMKAVETVWDLYHDFEAAKVLTHYASDAFIAEHFDQLAADYRYLPVRLRMSADYPVDRSRLEWHELIYLCARQHQPLTEQEAFAILSNTINLQLLREYLAFEGGSLFKLSYVRTIVLALGELGFTDILVRFWMENERTKPLFRHGEHDEVRQSICNQLYADGFCYFRDLLHTKEDLNA